MKLSALYRCLTIKEKFALSRLLEKEGIKLSDERKDVSDFIRSNYRNLSEKVLIVLVKLQYDGVKFIDEVEQSRFLAYQGVSRKLWDEFVAVRGY